MSVLLVTISGSSGGNKGPQGIYEAFQKHWENTTVKVISIDTVPDLIHENIDRVVQTVLQHQSFESVYLVGYSMGGAVAALSTYRLNSQLPDRVKGVVLLGTQTDGILALSELNIPVLFYHGKEDTIFPAWEIDSAFRSFTGPKKMVLIEEVGHNFAPEGTKSLSASHTKKLANHVMAEISSYFFQSNKERKFLDQQVVSKELFLGRSNGVLKRINNLFSR